MRTVKSNDPDQCNLWATEHLDASQWRSFAIKGEGVLGCVIKQANGPKGVNQTILKITA